MEQEMLKNLIDATLKFWGHGNNTGRKDDRGRYNDAANITDAAKLPGFPAIGPRKKIVFFNLQGVIGRGGPK